MGQTRWLRERVGMKYFEIDKVKLGPGQVFVMESSD